MQINANYSVNGVPYDKIMTYKLTVKTIAKRHGLYASFMPKPKYGMCGSGK